MNKTIGWTNIPIITFAHHKGGTGKTTSCLNISGFLQKAGNRVLVVDVDPQANATSGLGIDPEIQVAGMYDVFLSAGDVSQFTRIDDIILHTASGIDLAPSNLDLVGAEPFLYKVPDRFHILKRSLSELREEYQYILIDTPPSMGQLVINGLIAADYTVVTFDRGVFALNGMKNLITIFDDIAELVGERISPDMAILTRWTDENKRGRPGLLSMLGKLSLRRNSQDIKDEMAELDAIKHEVERYFKRVCVVPYSREIYEAQVAGLPISHFAPGCAAAVSYSHIAEEVTGWH